MKLNNQSRFADRPGSARENIAISERNTGDARSLLLLTSSINEAEQLCARVAIMARGGRLHAIGTMAQLKRQLLADTNDYYSLHVRLNALAWQHPDVGGVVGKLQKDLLWHFKGASIAQDRHLLGGHVSLEVPRRAVLPLSKTCAWLDALKRKLEEQDDKDEALRYIVDDYALDRASLDLLVDRLEFNEYRAELKAEHEADLMRELYDLEEEAGMEHQAVLPDVVPTAPTVNLMASESATDEAPTTRPRKSKSRASRASRASSGKGTRPAARQCEHTLRGT